jgi:hypothetical protein
MLLLIFGRAAAGGLQTVQTRDLSISRFYILHHVDLTIFDLPLIIFDNVIFVLVFAGNIIFWSPRANPFFYTYHETL